MKEEKKRILKLVEEGKLTVEEALGLLEELDQSNKTMEQKQEKLMGELSSVVKFEEAKKEQSSQDKFQTAKGKLFEFVDTAIKKIKELDLDFNFGHSIEISHVFQHGDVVLKDIDVNLANGSVKVIPWDQQDVRIECKAKVYRVETKEEARNTFTKDVEFNIVNQVLQFTSQQKWLKVEAVIYLPKNSYEFVKIRMFNGPIESENLKVKNYNVKTANGKISINGIQSKRVEAETANGQIFIEKGQIDDLEAETINGAIKVDGDFKKVELQSFNGNINCAVFGTVCQVLEAKATTGTINLSIPDHQPINGELKSYLGGLNVDLEGIQVLEEKNEVVQKLLRFKSIIQSEENLKLLADTKTGSITIKGMKS